MGKEDSIVKLAILIILLLVIGIVMGYFICVALGGGLLGNENKVLYLWEGSRRGRG